MMIMIIGDDKDDHYDDDHDHDHDDGDHDHENQDDRQGDVSHGNQLASLCL